MKLQEMLDMITQILNEGSDSLCAELNKGNNAFNDVVNKGVDTIRAKITDVITESQESASHNNQEAEMKGVNGLGATEPFISVNNIIREPVGTLYEEPNKSDIVVHLEKDDV